jgi:hypothetical protein
MFSGQRRLLTRHGVKAASAYRIEGPRSSPTLPMDTPIGYESVIVGQKRRNAPPMTHDQAEQRFQAQFRARTGEMSAPPLAPAGT